MDKKDFEYVCDECGKLCLTLYEDEYGNYLCLKCLKGTNEWNTNIT